MTQEQVNARLTSYRQNIGRTAHLREEIKHMEYLCAREAHRRAELSVSLTRPPTEMPGAGKIADTTGNAASYLADNGMSPEERALARNLEAMQSELYKLLRDIALVDAWVTCLREKERKVLMWRVLEECPWQDVIALYEKEYGQLYTAKALSQTKNLALRKIYRIAA